MNRRLLRHRNRLLAVLLIACALPALRADGQTPQPDPKLITLVRQAIAEDGSFKDRFDGEVWLLDMSARLKPDIPDAVKRLTLLRTVHAEAMRAGVPPELVLAVIQVESHFKRFAISRVGAEGLMQIMPFWRKEIGKPHANLFHMETNLRIGCTILRYYLHQAHGDLRHALALYNGDGRRYVYADRVLKALSNRWYRQ